MSKIKGRITAAVTALAVAGAVVGISLLGGGAADASQPRAAAAVVAPLPPNSVTGPVQVKDGTLYAADLAPGMVAWFTGGPYDGTVTTNTVKDGTLAEADLNAALKAKLNKVGTPGAPGADALLTVSADTMVTDRPDTATDGSVWAKDSMLRKITITRHGAVKASECGAGAVKCFYYTGTITDNGTFTTVAGAHGPNSQTPINNIVNGTILGVYEFEVNANTDLVDPSKVDSTVTGASPTTGDWYKGFFIPGTQFGGYANTDYSYDYFAAKTCEHHRQSAKDGNVKDILGVNLCTS